jgi:hypothetical protein
MEAFPTSRLALQLEVQGWNSGLDGRLVAASIHLEAAVAATSGAARLREPLLTALQVVGLYENPVTWKFDWLLSKNLNSELKKEKSYTCDPSKRGVEGLSGALGRGPYGKRSVDCRNYINHLLSNW